jgi:hypothetical protein
MKVEEILGTIKGEHESWKDVFNRVDASGGIDIKTLTKVVIYILEELDDRKDRYDTEFRPANENNRIQERTREVKEKIQPRTTDEERANTLPDRATDFKYEQDSMI